MDMESITDVSNLTFEIGLTGPTPNKTSQLELI